MIKLKIAKLIAASLIALLLPVNAHAEQQMPLTIQQTGPAKSYRQWYYSNSAPLDPHPDIRKYKKNEYEYDADVPVKLTNRTNKDVNIKNATIFVYPTVTKYYAPEYVYNVPLDSLSQTPNEREQSNFTVDHFTSQVAKKQHFYGLHADEFWGFAADIKDITVPANSSINTAIRVKSPEIGPDYADTWREWISMAKSCEGRIYIVQVTKIQYIGDPRYEIYNTYESFMGTGVLQWGKHPHQNSEHFIQEAKIRKQRHEEALKHKHQRQAPPSFWQRFFDVLV